MRSVRLLPLATGLLLVGAGVARSTAVQDRPIVYVAQIEGIIDLGLAPFVQRVLREAEREGARAVILEINTFGGRVDAAVVIRDALLGSPLQTVAFINRRAISAGALISLAATKIAMAEGGTIGAATPVQAGEPGGGARPVEEKTVSYVRKEFRATAEARGRPLEIAEAMVDADVVIPGLIEEDKLLTLTTDEALLHGVADFRANSVGRILEELGLQAAEQRTVDPNWAEYFVRFLTHPVISSLLLTVGMLGIILEVRTPGFGVGGAIGILALGLFLGGHWIVQLAGWEELLLVLAGLSLILVEVLVIPGFGIAGILGIAALLAGLTMSMIGSGAAAGFIVRAALRIVISLLLAAAASLALLRILPRMPFGKRLILDTGLGTTEGYSSAPEREHALVGKVGTTVTQLRPAGIATIDGERLDVVAEGEMVDPGVEVIVARVDGNRIVVRRHRTQPVEGAQG